MAARSGALAAGSAVGLVFWAIATCVAVPCITVVTNGRCNGDDTRFAVCLFLLFRVSSKVYKPYTFLKAYASKSLSPELPEQIRNATRAVPLDVQPSAQ